MRLVVLGSCGAKAAAGRACSGHLLELAGRRFWLDAGSGTLARLLCYTTLAALDAVFLSHLHADHWTDLPLAVHTLKQQPEREDPLPVLGPPHFVSEVGVPVRAQLETPDPVVAPAELADGLERSFGPVRLRATAVSHGDIAAFGVRLDGERESFFYTGDTGPFDGLAAAAAGVDVLLCECGSVPEEKDTHLTPEQAGELATAAGAGLLVLTHLMAEADAAEVRARAAAVFAGELVVAGDGSIVATR